MSLYYCKEAKGICEKHGCIVQESNLVLCWEVTTPDNKYWWCSECLIG